MMHCPSGSQTGRRRREGNVGRGGKAPRSEREPCRKGRIIKGRQPLELIEEQTTPSILALCVKPGWVVGIEITNYQTPLGRTKGIWQLGEIRNIPTRTGRNGEGRHLPGQSPGPPSEEWGSGLLTQHQKVKELKWLQSCVWRGCPFLPGQEVHPPIITRAIHSNRGEPRKG